MGRDRKTLFGRPIAKSVTKGGRVGILFPDGEQSSSFILNADEELSVINGVGMVEVVDVVDGGSSSSRIVVGSSDKAREHDEGSTLARQQFLRRISIWTPWDTLEGVGNVVWSFLGAGKKGVLMGESPMMGVVGSSSCYLQVVTLSNSQKQGANLLVE